MFNFFKKKNKIEEEVKEEKKQTIKSKIEVYYDDTLNILFLDGIEYKFTIESEERLQNFEKENKLKLYKLEEGLNIFRTRMFNTLLNFDRQALKFFLLVSQDKYNKVKYDDFMSYFDNLLKENKEIEISLTIFIHAMYSNYVGGKNFQKEYERRCQILMMKCLELIFQNISNLPSSIKDIVNVKLEQELKSFMK